MKFKNLVLVVTILTLIGCKEKTDPENYSLLHDKKEYTLVEEYDAKKTYGILEKAKNNYDENTIISSSSKQYLKATKKLEQTETDVVDTVLGKSFCHEEQLKDDGSISSSNEIYAESKDNVWTYNILSDKATQITNASQKALVLLAILESATPYRDVVGVSDLKDLYSGKLRNDNVFIQFTNSRTTRTVRLVLDVNNSYVFESKEATNSDGKPIYMDRTFLNYNDIQEPSWYVKSQERKSTFSFILL